jgi:hypothetical protein
MTETPFEHEHRKRLSKVERDARDAFRQVDAEKAMTEYEIAKKASSDNYERSRQSGVRGRPLRPFVEEDSHRYTFFFPCTYSFPARLPKAKLSICRAAV